MIVFQTVSGARFLCEPETVLGVLEVAETKATREKGETRGGSRAHCIFYVGVVTVKIDMPFDQVMASFGEYERLKLQDDEGEEEPAVPSDTEKSN